MDWLSARERHCFVSVLVVRYNSYSQEGELAQLVERVLSMHEVAGSIPAFSN